MYRLALALLLALTAVAHAQDVFVGARIDTEAVVGRTTKFDFGRDAGVDLTFSKARLIDAYADISAAGGNLRLQELYAKLPQTHRWVDVTIGRFLLPHGDPRTDVTDRYVPGGRDLFDTYKGYRRGNVFLDTDVTGLRLTRRLGPATLDLMGAEAPGNNLCFATRAAFDWHGARAGASWFLGKDRPGTPADQLAGYLGYSGFGVDASLNGYLGSATGGDHRGWAWRVAYRPPGSPVDGFVSSTLYRDDTMSAATTYRFGVRWRFGGYYRAEVRYEMNEAAGAAGHDDAVFRFSAVF